jgi:protein gp37
VIVGGESGPNARPMAAEWLTSLRDQCLLAGVPVFIKQLGAVMAQKFRCRDPKGGDMSEWPAEYRVRQFPTIAV